MRRKLRGILITVLSLAILGSGYYVISEWTSTRSAENSYAQMKEIFKLPDTSGSLSLMDFTQLKEKNSQIVAWITLDDTILSYPVVQGTDNSYYLNRTADRQSAREGAIFLDYRAEPDFSNFSSVIYGHNTVSGTMFGSLQAFKDREYFDTHKSGVLYTPENTYALDIVSVAITQPTSDYYKYSFSSPSEIREHILMLKNTALFSRDFTDITEIDNLIFLSTCSYERSNARTVLVLRLVSI